MAVRVRRLGKPPDADQSGGVRMDRVLIFETPRGGTNGRVTVEFDSKSAILVTEQEIEQCTEQVLQFLESELTRGRCPRSHYRLRDGVIY